LYCFVRRVVAVTKFVASAESYNCFVVFVWPQLEPAREIATS
jgi:hypothetical protein